MYSYSREIDEFLLEQRTEELLEELCTVFTCLIPITLSPALRWP